MPVLCFLVFGSATVYAAFVGACAVGLRRVLRSDEESSPDSGVPAGYSALPSVSVVVAARNEEKNIQETIRSILGCSYPAERLELIVVDDASSDATFEVASHAQRAFASVPVLAGADAVAAEDGPDLRVLRMEPSSAPGATGKRAALEAGIARASGEIILTTDADCTVGPGWIRSMVERFRPDVGFISGPVLYRSGPSLWQQAQALEFLGLVAMGAGAIGLGRPAICNGANSGFRTAAFRSVGGFGEAEGPGQEEMLMHRVQASGRWQVAFCADPAAVVSTHPAHDLSSFLQQRSRWAALAPRLPNPGLLAVLVGVFLFLLLLPVVTLLAVFRPELWLVVLSAWGVKIAADLRVLRPACRFFRRSNLLRVLLPAELVHPVYIVFSVASGLLGKYTWKGRSVTP